MESPGAHRGAHRSRPGAGLTSAESRGRRDAGSVPRTPGDPVCPTERKESGAGPPSPAPRPGPRARPAPALRVPAPRPRHPSDPEPATPRGTSSLPRGAAAHRARPRAARCARPALTWPSPRPAAPGPPRAPHVRGTRAAVPAVAGARSSWAAAGAGARPGPPHFLGPRAPAPPSGEEAAARHLGAAPGRAGAAAVGPADARRRPARSWARGRAGRKFAAAPRPGLAPGTRRVSSRYGRDCGVARAL